MFDTLKKVMYAGVGGVALAGEKASEAINELIEKGKITEKEGKELLEGYSEKINEEKGKLLENIDKAVAKQIRNLPLITKTKYEKLEKEIEILKAKVTELTPKNGDDEQL